MHHAVKALVLRRATRADLPRIDALLAVNKLPTVGVRHAIDGFLVADDHGTVVGTVGIESCGPRFGLLRSAVVDQSWRNKGIGTELVRHAIAGAKRDGVEALYLLTTTAERYFPLFGFNKTTREEVPSEVRATDEFRGACPDTATVMTLQLRDQCG
jgi:N-acetylglutamate synthase-like GNAT family acetyltransferase